MNTCVNCISVILLVFLIVSDQVQSNPETPSTLCRGDTAELHSNSFSVNKQNTALAEWAERQRYIPDRVCDKQSGVKTTCVMDYANTTESSDWCLDVPDTVYIETTFIYRCTNNDNNHQMYYSVRNRPACYASSCYDGYDRSIMEHFEQATFGGLVAEFSAPNTDSEWIISESVSEDEKERPTMDGGGQRQPTGTTAGEWDYLEGFDNCVELRLEITEPIVSVPGAGAVDPPTVSPAPTISPAPTQRPTISSAPTETPGPTTAALERSCENDSVRLVSGGVDIATQSLRGGNQNRANLVADGLSSIEGLLMIDTNTGMGFEKHCTTVDVDDIENVTAVCDFDYDDVIEFVADSDDSISRLCQNANGIYVEDSVSIKCTSDEDPSLITRLNFKNKPSCRSKLCNADGVRKVATTEFDRWMKLTLEEGLDQALAEAGDDNTVEILSGPQTCVIISDDEDEDDVDEDELVVVAVLGSTLSNIGGEPIPPTDECQAFTDVVDGTLDIYKQKAKFQRELLNYIDIDMREICASTTPGDLECFFDWTDVLVSSQSTASADTLKVMCMPDGNGSTGAGQYVESSFGVNCVDPDGKQLIMTNTNVPGCVGRPCTPGQAEYVFQDDYTFLAEKFIADGWNCTTEIYSVFAPHFNPFLQTYDLEEAQAQATSIIVDEKPAPPVESIANNDPYEYVGEITSPRKGVYANDENPPTLAPTGDAFHRGQDYGVLFRTQAPSPAYVEPVKVSSSYTRFSGIMTVLLVLPMTLSMIIF